MTKNEVKIGGVYSAIIREIAKKGDATRFVKTERGKFAASK